MTSAARRARLLAPLAALVILSAVPSIASADDKQLCVAASEKGQQLRSAGKLVEAREQLNVCGRTECPKLIQQDCTQWMSEVLASLPSVVPGAKDRKGRDVVQARLTIDGKVATETLDGKPIVVDPGVHSFVFEAKGPGAGPAVKEQVVVKPGEKNRIVIVTVATGDDVVAAASAGNGTREEAKSSPPIAAYVLGGLGVVALGAAGVMGLLANSDAHDLRSTCAPNCKQSDVDAIQTRYTIGGVTAGVGGALLITGVVLFIVHGKGTRTGSNATPLSFQPELVASGSSALVRF
ncbi:MAG: hypothetical protein JWO86_8547 [Myxococcaceae bacterium]|jgi:hypothetical protein|nr:hypothetical protein [Myxococcaceae bacterium]MEA2751155.1 hypothetical protein [Myxococcales bacterium]